jgi:hypothetical protein
MNPSNPPTWFAQPLQAAVPIAFLPLRLETRFGTGTGTSAGPELWVRAYPDDVHVDSFEPELTAVEQAARAAYVANPDATGSDPDKRLAAWAALATRFGAARAAWIASDAAATAGTKDADWMQAATTALLPDRLIFTAYDMAGTVIRQAGNTIADGLVLGPSPSGGDPGTDAGLQWTRDFKHAIDLGLAIRLPITAAQATSGFTRIVVFGVKSNLAPADGPVRLAAAIDAHHFTDGAAVLPLNTPTNNADDTKAGYRSDDPGFTVSCATERGAPLVPSGDGRAEGDRLAAALGLAPVTFAHIRGSDGRSDDAPAAMNTVLWPATLGYYLENLVTGAVPDVDNVIPAAGAHFATWLRARGPWPALRFGRQPYGIVPVVAAGLYQPIEGGPLAPHLSGLLQKLRPYWESSSANVARVVPGADPDSTLTAILSQSPFSTTYAGRTALGPQFSAYYWPFVGETADETFFSTVARLSTSAIGTNGSALAATRLGGTTFLDKHFSLAPALVNADLNASPLTGNFLSAFAGMTMAQLRDAAPPPSPAPLLWLLVRHAALRQYAESAYALLGTAVAAADRIEPEIINISPTVQTPRVWDHLALTTTATGPVGTYLDQHKTDGPPAFVAFWKALSTLAAAATSELDSALRETLDLCSYRLDAWFTSLATQRLDTVRKQSGNAQTLYLGAYGWVENVKPKSAVASWGYVHAPSLGHAVTAAVLRSGYLSHQSSGSQTAAIDLSSTRTRRALQILEAVRAGQPLGAELGYQLERALHEQSLDAYIAPFRTLAQTGEVAGDPVVDGLALLQQQSTIQWNGTTFPATGTAEYTALTALLAQLSDTLDAVSDVMIAESVHQLVNGSALRAGATVDALGRGDSPPPVPDVTQTPLRGATITHRLLAMLPEGPAAWWPATPRGAAEPRLDAFAAQLLGTPTRVTARAAFLDASGATLSSISITLADTGLGPLDVLALAGRMPGIAGQSEIEQRLVRAAWAKRPAATPAGAQVALTLDRDTAWSADTLSIDELLAAATSARALLAGARAATAADFTAGDQAADIAIDTTDLQNRGDTAATRLAAVRAAFDATGAALDAALDGAAQLGVPGSVPSPDATTWPAQASVVKGVLDSQIAKLAALEAGFTRAGASETVLCDHDVARLAVVFGDGLTIVPKLMPAATATFGPLFAQSSALLQGRPLDAVTYFQRVARIRAGVARLDESLLFAETLQAGAQLQLAVAQLPAVAGEVWAGLPLAAGATAQNRLSLLAYGDTATAQAALYVDEWLETIPAALQTTGLTFHVDDSQSRAPQAIVLGVQPDSAPQWTNDSVEQTILEAIDLTHLRAVDPDTLSAVGHFLPATFFAANLASPPDAIATDLTAAAPPIVVRPIITDPIFGKLVDKQL